ncbi:TPA: hypothetical protein RY256_002601 [Salmonella enterica]|nr:hypothetical protein [Salmonella enterica]HEB0795964.1 hypothetical protein [Salmonella enterica]HEB0806472.1 hypothetical protein [Salmonella enterica]HEB0810771.1 hypothetical protein [Salmonella enterica]HEB0815346.1 hypothetical protein [Salmonella enterica]
MTTNTNNKLTDERPDDEGLELLITIRREIAGRHASEGRMAQSAVHTLILNALLELQERRKADNAEPAVVTGSQEFPDLKSEKTSPPVTKFDNEYIRTRLEVFGDTDEVVEWLLDLADEYHEERNFAEEYNLREAAISLCGMYADLKDFGNVLMQSEVTQPEANN